MKKTLTLAATLLAFSAFAQTASTQPVSRGIDDVIGVAMVLLVVPTLIVTATSLTGNNEALCARLQGKYLKSATGSQEQCPGGSWAVALGIARPK